jgi:LEA14-like dessication related protein
MKMFRYGTLVMGLVVISLSGCAALEDALLQKKPTASLVDVHLTDISLKSASLVFDVEVENPYSAGLPLVNLDYEVSSKAQQLFNGAAELQTTIPAQSSQEVALPVTLNYLDLVQAFKDVRPGSVIPYEAALGLSLDAPVLGRIRLPINKSGQLTVPTIPKASDVDWKKLLDKVTK